MATPTTLIGLLWAVHYGWRQELIAESAREIAESARELHSRLGRFVEPLSKVGRQLDSAVCRLQRGGRLLRPSRDPPGAPDRAGRRGLRTRGARARPRWRSPPARSPRGRSAGPRSSRRGRPGEPRSLRTGSGSPAGAEDRAGSARAPPAPSPAAHRRGRTAGRRPSARIAVSAAARSCSERPTVAASSAPEHAGDEQVAVAHHRRAEHRALKLRQAGHRMRGVEGVVGPLQQVGDHQRRVGDGHRHDPGGQPARRRDGREQHAERRAAERREDERRPLARQAAAIDPRQREQRQDEQRPRRTGGSASKEPARGRAPRARAPRRGRDR